MRHLSEAAREFVGSIAAIISCVITMGCIIVVVDYL